MKYRIKTEIVNIMLEVAASGSVNKMRLMYGTLSFNQLKGYLHLLTEGLIDFNEMNSAFKISPKGRQFLKICRGIDTLYFPAVGVKIPG